MTEGRTELRVIELSRVTDHELQTTIEPLLNEGWELDHIDYIKESGVRRPQMAFVFMRRSGATRPTPQTDAADDARDEGAT